MSWMLSSTSGAAPGRRCLFTPCAGLGLGFFFLFGPGGGRLWRRRGGGFHRRCGLRCAGLFAAGYAGARRGGAATWPGPRFAGRRQHFFLFFHGCFLSCSVFARPAARPASARGRDQTAGRAWARTGMARLISFSISGKIRQLVLAAKLTPRSRFSPLRPVRPMRCTFYVSGTLGRS